MGITGGAWKHDEVMTVWLQPIFFTMGVPSWSSYRKYYARMFGPKKYFRLDQLVSEHAKTAMASKLYK